jgi:hypothetical protein
MFVAESTSCRKFVIAEITEITEILLFTRCWIRKYVLLITKIAFFRDNFLVRSCLFLIVLYFFSDFCFLIIIHE